MVLSRNFFKALGYMTYAIARADGTPEVVEAQKMVQAILDEFGGWESETSGVAAQATFEIACNGKFTVEHAYDKGVSEFDTCRDELKKHRHKVMAVLQKVCKSDNEYSTAERQVFEKFDLFTSSI